MAIAGSTDSVAGGGFNPYAAGDKVYNGGSPNPTSGTVDPTGYVQRELNNSQSRSGLARAALDRMRGFNGSMVNPTLGTGVGTGSVMSPIVKPLEINSLGQLNLPSNKTLSLDSDLVAQMAAGLQSANNQLMALQQQQQNISQNYASQARQMTNQEPDILNQLLSNYAGRGLAHSSGYGQSLTNEQNRYSQALDTLFNQSQQGINSIASQATQVPTALDSLIAQLQGTQSQRNVQQAGTLALNNQLAQLLNPDTNTQFYGVTNEADRQAALKAGVPASAIRYVGGNSGADTSNLYGLPVGIGSLPQGAQNVVYIGQAGKLAPSGAQTAVGRDRVATQQILQQLLAGK